MGLGVEVSNSEISDRAAEWVARFDREGENDAVLSELNQWLGEDRRHRGAYVRALAAWITLDRAQILKGRSDRSPSITRRRVIAAGVAASAATAAASSMLWWGSAPAHRYVTAMGDFRRVKLADGSAVSLNSNSEILVAMTARKRSIKLVSGEAWFDVAKDPDRPFTVDSDRFLVRAVGTAFSVSRGHREDGVLVTEGVVELQHASEASPVQLKAGSRAFMRQGRLETQQVSDVEMERILAWREGEIGLDGETLSEAVEMFNRYNARKLEIRDPRLADAKMIGWFRLGDPETFAHAAALTLNANVQSRDDRIVLAGKSE